MSTATLDKATEMKSFMDVRAYLEELGLATASPHAAEAPTPGTPPPTQLIFTTEPERQAARTTLEVIREFEKTTKLADLSRPEVQASIVAQVKQRLLPVQVSCQALNR